MKKQWESSPRVLKHIQWSSGDITRACEIHNLKFACTNKIICHKYLFSVENYIFLLIIEKTIIMQNIILTYTELH